MIVQASSAKLAATSTLLAISGALTVAGSAQRWWPACQIGAFDTNSCPERQDHAYTYVWPREPWTPVGIAAELHGTAMLVLAVAVLLLPGVVHGRRPGWMLTVAALMVSASVAVSALPTLLSGLEGKVVSLPNMWLPAVLYVIGLPALLIVWAARHDGPTPRPACTVGAVICLIVANPLILYLVAPMIFWYSSYDTTPWTEAVGGVFLIGAGIFLWLGLHRGHAPDADVGDSYRRAAVLGMPS